MVKVLFIDDEPAAHRTIELVLPDPYVLISAYSACHGIEVLKRDGPDVVLLDINLPDMDGLAALRQIAARPLAPPVVMLTASTIRQQSHSRRALEFQASSVR
jgi:CheY-like chemotaxis protein